MEQKGLSELGWKGKEGETMCGWTLKTSGDVRGNLVPQKLPKAATSTDGVRWSCFRTGRQCLP